MIASNVNSRMLDDSTPMTRMFSLWKPWLHSDVLVKKRLASWIAVTFQPMSCRLLLWMVMISRQSVSLT